MPKRAVTLNIRLFNVDIEALTPGQPLECTVNGEPNDAKYLELASLPRTIWAEIAGLRETPQGKVVPDLFESYRDEFVIGSDGTAWEGYAGMILSVEAGK